VGGAFASLQYANCDDCRRFGWFADQVPRLLKFDA
jgi:hypothetical protein